MGLNSRFDLMFAQTRVLTGNERNEKTRQHLCLLLFMWTILLLLKISNIKLINAVGQLFIPRLPF